MALSKCHILLMMSSLNDNDKNVLREFLQEKGYEVSSVENANEGILKAKELFPDLIICQNRLPDKSGLQVFNLLQGELGKRAVPFFLYMPEYNKEDVLIGLEMGVDSFIIHPFDTETLNKKVDYHLNKVRKFKLVDSEQFKALFDTTPVAKFVVENSRLKMVNKAFEKLTGLSWYQKKLPNIEDVFDFYEDETLALEFRKCINGLKEHCLIKSVPLMTNRNLRFDIQLVHTDYFGKGLFMAEVVSVPETSATTKGEVKNADNGGQYFGVNGDKVAELSKREKEVLEWSAQGLPIKQIARILNISDRTVEKHRANIMKKTEATSMVEAIYVIRGKLS